MTEQESNASSLQLQSAHEHHVLTHNELRQRGLLWLWGVIGACFLLWFMLDLIWPPPGQWLGTQQTGQLISWSRLGLTAILWLSAGAVMLWREHDIVVVLAEWLGWLCLSLYLGVAGAWVYGGGGALVTTMLALLIVSRGIAMPSGAGGFWPPVLLLWSISTLCLVMLSDGWVWSAMLFLQVLLLLAACLGAAAATLLSRFRAYLAQTDRLGRYRIEERLRTRGMSQLYKAWHLLLQQPCVIKRIPCYTSNWDAAVEEFRREAKLVMGIQTPHVVRVFDFGETQVDLYLAMEQLDGVNLQALLRLHGPLPQRRAVFLMQQVCKGMVEVHRQGILHQDLKPSNLYLVATRDEYDFVKVIDFGIARRIDATAKQLAARGRGKIPGTPAYMAPERFAGQSEVTSDIYALGAVFYCLLTARPPFRAKTVGEYQALHEKEELSLSHLHSICPDILPQVEHVITRAMSKDPGQRFSSVGQMLNALEACQEALGQWSQEEAQQAWEGLLERRDQHQTPGASAQLVPPALEAEAPTPPKETKAPAPIAKAPALILPSPDDPELDPGENVP